jgi:hypothetical protein
MPNDILVRFFQEYNVITSALVQDDNIVKSVSLVTIVEDVISITKLVFETPVSVLIFR